MEMIRAAGKVQGNQDAQRCDGVGYGVGGGRPNTSFSIHFLISSLLLFGG